MRRPAAFSGAAGRAGSRHAALALSRPPAELSAAVAGLDLSRSVVLLVILLISVILGCFMESLAMVPLMLSPSTSA
ncbi:MAG: hypothetical protein K2X11_06800 [Acetobacteraceae bacterium]|nr:hypothetical protein [Acetobacteraceae bacterium]